MRSGLHHVELRGATFLGLAETAPGHRLVPVGKYMGLVTCGDPAKRVPGEVFEVSEELLANLDAFEGTRYRRFMLEFRWVDRMRWGGPSGTELPAEGADRGVALAYGLRTR
jgi:gamma-glutamylcyclotransferase (GGCT)/AIG2-like uncharacterized protein YtfP